ncbi:hypothetical protein GQ44DRAFT_608755 [Phaeosphaeriaceae sp. PMI808]|nr:hypothetical protein GQ44DRAFT_608755 [Phaeosphaeriaceae sp. PMI808]
MPPIPTLVLLDTFRLPNHPHTCLLLHGSPLAILDTTQEITNLGSTLSPNPAWNAPLGIATVLYNWCPDALAAFLDFDAWFSLTWSLTIQQGESDESNIEIGRVGNQITFGTLDKNGEIWTLMLTYNVCLDGPERGVWLPNPKECMKADVDITDPLEIDKYSLRFVSQLVSQKHWDTGKKVRHKFYVEYAPMDVWGDGIPMNPHWLYKNLSFLECTTCGKGADANDSPLHRCGKCGTATYCSNACQHKDWAVHKHICSLSLEDRGQMLAITKEGGLINWDREKTFATEGSGEESRNPNFAQPQLKRT